MVRTNVLELTLTYNNHIDFVLKSQILLSGLSSSKRISIE
jgi:hypothetical protein